MGEEEGGTLAHTHATSNLAFIRLEMLDWREGGREEGRRRRDEEVYPPVCIELCPESLPESSWGFLTWCWCCCCCCCCCFVASGTLDVVEPSEELLFLVLLLLLLLVPFLSPIFSCKISSFTTAKRQQRINKSGKSRKSTF